MSYVVKLTNENAGRLIGFTARLNRLRPAYARVFGRAVRCLALYINNNNTILR